MAIRRKIENTVSKRELLEKRDRDLIKDFTHLTKVKKLDVSEVICNYLQNKYYLQPSTIVLIINGSYGSKLKRVKN